MTHPTHTEQGLASCPFCGGKAALGYRSGEQSHIYYMRCQAQSGFGTDSVERWNTARSPHAAASGTETLLDRVRELEEALGLIAEGEFWPEQHHGSERFPTWIGPSHPIDIARKALGQPHD